MLTTSRVIGYTRVSTIEQASSGAGLTAQREAIEAECRRRDWDLVDIHEDAGLSGGSMKGRDGLAACLDGLHSGAANVLVVSKLDRLSRSLIDFATLMRTAAKGGWAVVALDLGVDMTTPAGKMMANVLASFAEYEREIIGQRTREGLAVKRAEGVRLGRPPSVPDTTMATIVGLRDDGAGVTAIADHLNESGVPTSRGGRAWYPSTVRAVLGRASV